MQVYPIWQVFPYESDVIDDNVETQPDSFEYSRTIELEQGVQVPSPVKQLEE